MDTSELDKFVKKNCKKSCRPLVTKDTKFTKMHREKFIEYIGKKKFESLEAIVEEIKGNE